MEAQKTKKKVPTWLIVVLVIAGLGIIGSIVNRSKGEQSTPAAAPTAEESKTPAPPPEPQEIVSNSAWDGSVSQVKEYLRKNLNDAKSVEYVEWSPVFKFEDGSGFAVRCKYRAKNSFGAYVLEEKLFKLDSAGRVIGHTDYTP